VGSTQLPASFRDPSGFLFRHDGVIYRQVNLVYKDDYNHLMDSGLYQALINDSLLIPHEEVGIESPAPELAYKIIRPEPIPFISYPYEWCFSQLRDAGIGWQHKERMSLVERGPADAVLALALVHHLAISNNLPFSRIAGFLSDISHWLIVEFIPKTDSQVQRLLATREDIFPDYTRQAFEQEFSRYFAIDDPVDIQESQRTLYLMRRLGE
jgi:hypothetical protein